MSRPCKILCIVGSATALLLGAYFGVLYVADATLKPKTEYVGTQITPECLAACEKLMHLTLPPSTRANGFCYVQGFQDDYAYLKLEVDRAELQVLLDSSPFAGQPLRTDRIRIASNGPRWWAIDELKRYEGQEGQTAFRAGEASLPEAEYLNILLDVRDDKVVVVYLEWIET